MFGDSLLPSECSLIIEGLKQTSLCFQVSKKREMLPKWFIFNSNQVNPFLMCTVCSWETNDSSSSRFEGITQTDSKDRTKTTVAWVRTQRNHT